MNKVNKVLIIGPKFFGINHSVGRGLMKAGCQIKIVEFEEIYPNSWTTKFTCGFLRKIGIQYFVHKYDDEVNRMIVDTFRQFKPDMVVVIKGHKVNSETLTAMKKAKLVLWMMDSICKVPDTLENVHLYDSIYVFDENDIAFLRNYDVVAEFLPLALDEKEYFPFKNREIINDIVFVGSLYNNRVGLIKELVESFPDKRIVAYGPFPSLKSLVQNYWLKFGRFRENFRIGYLSPQEINEIIAGSNIVINLHADDSLSGCNLRFFEVAGTGKIQVVNRKRFIETNFNMEQLLFDRVEEIGPIIEEVFEDSTQAEAIAESTYQLVVENHTYYDRALKLLA